MIGTRGTAWTRWFPENGASYVLFEPSLAFVAEDAAGVAVPTLLTRMSAEGYGT
jgi:hypothetical protein